MTEIKELTAELRARADFIDRDTYDECWEVQETPQGAMLRQAASTIESMSSQVAELKAALRPFADAAEYVPGDQNDHKLVAYVPAGAHKVSFDKLNAHLTAGSFRAARSALSLGST